MEQSKKLYIITRMNGMVCSFLLRDGKAVEIHRDEGRKEPSLGSIYVGKIKNIAKNIGAAFVETSPGITCYLPLTDLKCPVYTKKGNSPALQAGDELLVQVSREGIKTKFPAVTTNLTFHGKYVLLTTGDDRISVSSRLSPEKRQILLDFYERWNNSRTKTNISSRLSESDQAESLVKRPDTVIKGWLFRTNAGDASEEMISRDMEQLQKRYESVMAQADYRTCFTCMERMPEPYLKRLQNLYESEVDQILTDDRELYSEVKAYLCANQEEDLKKLTFYEDELLPMNKLYSLEHQLSRAMEEKVWMGSGGYLVIQPTEALTVIDVNTGKYEGGKQKEASFLKINLEAALEIARQIRLRNLSGIIIVDFINMKSQESNKKLLDVLAAELKKDPVQTVLVDMTKLSLVEITRKKKEKPL